MITILVAGAGGAPSEGVIRSLKMAPDSYRVVGIGPEPTDLALSVADIKYLVPYPNTDGYLEKLLTVIELERPDLLHFQHDLEIFRVSSLRDTLTARGPKLFMPTHSAIDTCVHKAKSYEAFSAAGIRVPVNLPIASERDLAEAFVKLANEDGELWLRSSLIGGGGVGSLKTADINLARAWINHHSGWGSFLAAQLLTDRTVTWLSIWKNGELIVAQSRERRGWTHSSRSVSGVTGVTKVGVTCNDTTVTDIATAAIYAVTPLPHGIFGVDMAYDIDGVPNPTEINISRFFTTVEFFSAAGLNLPDIFVRVALDMKLPDLERHVNPLPSGLMWLRGMDVRPRLLPESDLLKEVKVV